MLRSCWFFKSLCNMCAFFLSSWWLASFGNLCMDELLPISGSSVISVHSSYFWTIFTLSLVTHDSLYQQPCQMLIQIEHKYNHSRCKEWSAASSTRPPVWLLSECYVTVVSVLHSGISLVCFVGSLLGLSVYILECLQAHTMSARISWVDSKCAWKLIIFNLYCFDT